MWVQRYPLLMVLVVGGEKERGGGAVPVDGHAWAWESEVCMEMDKAWIVARGVDTLVVNAFYANERGEPVKGVLLNEVLFGQLDAWKLGAQQLHEEVPTDLVFHGKTLHMCPNGAGRGQWPWMLKSRDITLYISRGNWNGNATVRLSSEYLWSCGRLLDAIGEIQVFLDEVFRGEMYLQVSEVHLCADVAGWDGVEKLDRTQHFVSHSRKRSARFTPDWGFDSEVQEHSYGLQGTGFEFSSGGPVSCIIYEKSREIRRSGKGWFEDIWRVNGWSDVDEQKIWRVEMRFKREALHELQLEGAFHGIEDVYSLPDRLPLLWAYGVGSPLRGTDEEVPDGWLRCVVPGNDKKRSRWPTHPTWEVVQRAFLANTEVPEQVGKVVRKRHEEHNIHKALEAVMGYLTSLAAWAGGELAHEGVDLSVVLHWLMQRGSEYLERVDRDFAVEVQRKRTRFGVGDA